jgi:hypothetical protein
MWIGRYKDESCAQVSIALTRPPLLGTVARSFDARDDHYIGAARRYRPYPSKSSTESVYLK